MLARMLAEGLPAQGQPWRVTRAWPAVLDDPDQGYVLELKGADGRVRGARLRGDTVELPDDHSLPALTPLVSAGWTVLAHRLGKRAVLRRDGAGPFRKLATAKATRRAIARADAVDHLLTALPTVPRPPERIGMDSDAGTLDLAPARGVALRDLLTDPRTEPASAWTIGRRLGEVLAALATLAEPSWERGLPAHGPADEAAVVERWVAAACALAPLSDASARRLRAEADAVIAALTREPARPGVLAHRDLHDGQILVPDEGELTLLDWDTAAWADPCLDTANLLAHFDLLVRHRPDAVARVRGATDGLLAALAEGGHPAAGSADQLDLWRRASAVRIAAVHAFRVRGG